MDYYDALMETRRDTQARAHAYATARGLSVAAGDAVADAMEADATRRHMAQRCIGADLSDRPHDVTHAEPPASDDADPFGVLPF